MFIDWAAKLNLLEHDPESHILKEFSLPVKKILVQQVVTFLLEHGTSKILSSPSHVRWAMETCGQGFSLPIEEEDSILKVITLYRGWILEPKNRPASISDNFQYFATRILQHYSLLFEARANQKDMIERHAQMCSTVLDIFASIGRNVGPSLSVETWEVFLKLLIGITDSILHPEASEVQKPFQTKLCSQVLRVLFELWLLSRTRNPALWDALKQRVRGWTHHRALITTWNVVCFALTRRSIAVLYGAREGSESVILKLEETPQSLQLEDEYVFYSWHRMLYLIGNPNESIHDPDIFLSFMSGVDSLVNQYLRIGTQNIIETAEPSRYISPTGNTILHIFGSWLFDAIHLNRARFDEGTALAVKTLCNTMISKFQTDFLTVYSSSFYSCMQSALSREGRVLVAVITSSTALFRYELKGIRCLVPFFVAAIERIFLRNAKLCDAVIPSEHVRKACMVILGTILCLPNYFKESEFALYSSKAPPDSGAAIKNFSQLKPRFSKLILEALQQETTESNIEQLLKIAYVWQSEDVNYDPSTTNKLIKLILRKITESQWSPDISIVGLDILAACSRFYSLLNKPSKIACSVVGKLCSFAYLLGNPCPLPQERLVISSYNCLCNWIMVPEQWILDQQPTKLTLLTAIVIGLTGKSDRNQTPDEPTQQSKKKLKPKKEPEKSVAHIQIVELSEAIKEAARRTLFILLNHLGNFPTASGAASISTLATEEEILGEMIQKSNGQITVDRSKEFLRYFITDDRIIICLIDRRYFDPNGLPCSTMIIRDENGRFCWDTQLRYLPLGVKAEYINRCEPVPVCATPFQKTQVHPMDTQSLNNVLAWLENSVTKPSFSLVQEQVTKEFKILKRNDFRLNHDQSVVPPRGFDPFIGDCQISQSRMFFSHMGFLAVENRDRLYPIHTDQNFFDLLQQLDHHSERICMSVGVLYIRHDQFNEEWYGNEGGSMDYQEFIANLGWGVALSSHHGYCGTLDTTGFCGKTAPYWSNYSVEMIFQVCTLMPNNPQYPSHAHKRKQSTNGACIVVWTENIESFSPQSIWKKMRHPTILLVIAPLPFGGYLIRLFSKSDLVGIGPLMDGLIVTKPILAQLVRDTCLCIWQRDNRTTPSPAQVRADTIEKIYQNSKRLCTLEQFYTSQFTSVLEPQIGPLQVPTKKKKEKVRREGSLSGSAVRDRSANPPPSPAPPSMNSSNNAPAGNTGWLGSGSNPRVQSPPTMVAGQQRRGGNSQPDGEDEEKPTSDTSLDKLSKKQGTLRRKDKKKKKRKESVADAETPEEAQ